MAGASYFPLKQRVSLLVSVEYPLRSWKHTKEVTDGQKEKREGGIHEEGERGITACVGDSDE